ncbi:hypothetical protein CMV_029956 [Castanea mollissima]|uniref:Uncharacterized protein n=1 Tax=Castanea mollissima TaxID=60419 RepID=A0A8J4Q9I5_9ROSI|nr:hypothetical protein CMV_029956 [Castanea mollissima]
MYYSKARQSKTWLELELQNVVVFLDIELTIDLVLNWQAMAVPAEAVSDVEAVHGLVLGDDVLDGAGEDVAVVREFGDERRTIVESVLRRVFGPFEVSLEGLDLRLEAEDFLLVFREGEVCLRILLPLWRRRCESLILDGKVIIWACQLLRGLDPLQRAHCYKSLIEQKRLRKIGE